MAVLYIGGRFNSSHHNPIELFWSNSKCGFKASKNNDIVIPCLYDSYVLLSTFSVALKKNGRWGIVNDYNELLCDFIYERIETPSLDTKICSAMKDGKWGLIFTEDGRPATSFDFNLIHSIVISTYSHIYSRNKTVYYAWALTHNGKVFAYDSKANLIYPKSFDNIKTGIQCYEPCLIVENNFKFGLLTLSGNLISQCIYDEIVQLQSIVDDYEQIATFSYAATRIGEKWGIMGKDGSIILKNQFDGIKAIGNCIALKHASKWGILSADKIKMFEENRL